MHRKPALWVGLAIWLAYNAVIFGVWFAVGADYGNLAGRDVILERLLLPEVLGALLMIGAITWLGWWRPVMTEAPRGGPRWAMWVLFVPIAVFIVVLLGATDWSVISTTHLALLIVATALIGFNEEALTRGVLVVAARGSIKGEAWVWLISTGLFALMHLPNGLFGPGLGASTGQVVFTFLLGSGLYLLRRVSGTLIVPIIVHAMWDLAAFAHQLPGEGLPPLGLLGQFLTYLVAIVLVMVVLRHGRDDGPVYHSVSKGAVQ